VPAELARAVVCRFRGREMVAEAVADLLEDTGFEPGAVFAQLEAAGYMEKVQVDNDGDVWWDTTIQGNAPAMASFGKPISRKTADRLMSELLERARAYNADPGRPMFIETLRVFGSYLSPEIDPLGDIDIEPHVRPKDHRPEGPVGLHQSKRTIARDVHGPVDVAADGTGSAPEETAGVHQHHAGGHHQDHRPIRDNLQHRRRLAGRPAARRQVPRRPASRDGATTRLTWALMMHPAT